MSYKLSLGYTGYTAMLIHKMFPRTFSGATYRLRLSVSICCDVGGVGMGWGNVLRGKGLL